MFETVCNEASEVLIALANIYFEKENRDDG